MWLQRRKAPGKTPQVRSRLWWTKWYSPALDMILATAFFVKLGSAYFDYRQRGQFEWTGPAILFACLIFTLTAPKYIWTIIGI